MENVGRVSTTSMKVSIRTGSSGANTVPWTFRADQPARHGVTPADEEGWGVVGRGGVLDQPSRRGQHAAPGD